MKKQKPRPRRMLSNKHNNKPFIMPLSNKNIIIIAGPSASGKSCFIKKLLSGNSQTPHEMLLRNLSLLPSFNIGKLNIERLSNENKVRKRSKKMRKDAFIVHFDLTSRHQYQRRSQLKAIASQCKTLKVVTLEVSFSTWQMRMTQRIKNEFYGMPLSKAFWIYAFSLINNKYGRECLNSVYREWDSFLETIPTDERLFFNSETGQLRTKQAR